MKPTMSISQVQNVRIRDAFSLSIIKTYMNANKAGKKLNAIARPLQKPRYLPDPGELRLNFDHEIPEPEPDFNASHRKAKEKSYTEIAGPNHDFVVPTLGELGLKPATTPENFGRDCSGQGLHGDI